MSSLLVLGAGYIGAALAELALARGDAVLLADDWSTTRREQLAGLEAAGARVRDADIGDAAALRSLVAEGPDRVFLLAAQASRPTAMRDPERTEATNLVGVRRVAEAVGDVPLVFASSLHVYGPDARGEIGPDHPLGRPGDLVHATKVYGELCVPLYARRVALARLGIVYGPSPVEHDDPAHVTVVDTFRRRAAAGQPLVLDDGGRATIGVVHVADAARILLDCPEGAHHVVAETVTVADVAALAEGRPPPGGAVRTYTSTFAYRHRLADHLAA